MHIPIHTSSNLLYYTKLLFSVVYQFILTAAVYESLLLTSMLTFSIVTLYFYYYFINQMDIKGSLTIITVIFKVTFLGEGARGFQVI